MISSRIKREQAFLVANRAQIDFGRVEEYMNIRNMFPGSLLGIFGNYLPKQMFESAATQDFGKRLNAFSTSQLMLLNQYFSQDLMYITENDIALMLQELTTRGIITSQDAQMYTQLEKKMGGKKTADKIANNVLSKSPKDSLEFWKCLYSLRSNWSHPNLNRLVEELSCRGQDLLEEILLNKDGHVLDQELKDAQEKLKEVLWDQTKALNERIHGAEIDPRGFCTHSHYVEAKMVSGARFQRKEIPKHQALMAVGELRQCHLPHNLLEGPEWITCGRLFHWCRQSHRTPQAVMVSGAAGVGKTTLVQKFILDWVTGKHYQKFAFVFFFKFRDLNFLGDTSLEVLLQREYPQLYSRLDTILQHPEKLLFIFDGLDESHKVLDLSHDRSPDLCVRPGDVKPVHVIVASLLKQTLLKDSSVLLTSHPATLATLEMKAFDRVVTIMGFLARDRDQYFRDFFGEGMVAKRVLSYVKNSQVLYALCHNPSYCRITCVALDAYVTSASSQCHPLPQTVTQLLVGYMNQVMDRHGGGGDSFVPGSGGDTPCPSVKEFVVRLGSLAARCLQTRTLAFKERDLEACRITPSAHPSLFAALVVEDAPKSRSSCQATYSFRHLGVQEFFAALFHFLDFKESSFSDILEFAQSDSYDIFLRFLAGLSHQKTWAPLEERLGKFSGKAGETMMDWLGKKDLKEALLGATTQSEKQRALSFFNLLFEAQDGHLVCQLLGDSAGLDFSELHLMPADCAILGYVLNCCPSVGLLNLRSCFIHNEGLEELSRHLHVVRDLKLQDNCLKDSAVDHLVSALKHPQCQLESLSLARNTLTRNDCEVLCSSLLENQSLLNLNLSKTELRNDGLSALLKVFETPACKIQKLILQENVLSDASCELLSSALARNTSLVSLNLCGNPLTDNSVSDLSAIIQRCSLQEIRLDFTDITPPKQNQLKILASKQERVRLYI
ncbi:NACHT, LRR and PYD domains-containing protein 12-like [Erythrolamprus reginae]|uniref:NACHT, LRR and PYD domains-containing protein 12-like n=1 Tax=Erythrolamprus reginae TaxID=121349 RepID=UPI00396C95A4